jgi:hypothetical protein
MRDNQGKRYDRLLKEIFIEVHGEYDEGDPSHADEIAEMSDYFSTEELPHLYAPDRGDWIKAHAAQWVEHCETEMRRFD